MLNSGLLPQYESIVRYFIRYIYYYYFFCAENQTGITKYEPVYPSVLASIDVLSWPLVLTNPNDIRPILIIKICNFVLNIITMLVSRPY